MFKKWTRAELAERGIYCTKDLGLVNGEPTPCQTIDFNVVLPSNIKRVNENQIDYWNVACCCDWNKSSDCTKESNEWWNNNVIRDKGTNA